MNNFSKDPNELRKEGLDKLWCLKHYHSFYGNCWICLLEEIRDSLQA